MTPPATTACPRCGTALEPTARFCGACGTAVPDPPGGATRRGRRPVLIGGVVLLAVVAVAVGVVVTGDDDAGDPSEAATGVADADADAATDSNADTDAGGEAPSLSESPIPEEDTSGAPLPEAVRLTATIVQQAAEDEDVDTLVELAGEADEFYFGGVGEDASSPESLWHDQLDDPDPGRPDHVAEIAEALQGPATFWSETGDWVWPSECAEPQAVFCVGIAEDGTWVEAQARYYE